MGLPLLSPHTFMEGYSKFSNGVTISSTKRFQTPNKSILINVYLVKLLSPGGEDNALDGGATMR